MKVLADCGRRGSARKILIQDKNKKLYTCYCYFGNPIQDFVIDEKENLIPDGILRSKIILTARDYIFNNYIMEGQK